MMELELTIPQLRVMFLLLDSELARMSFIAQEIGISLPASTHLIDRLVSGGYVERSVDPEDRRAVCCSLTESGKDALDKLRQQTPFEQDEIVDRLSISELKVVVEAMEIMQRVMKETGS